MTVETGPRPSAELSPTQKDQVKKELVTYLLSLFDETSNIQLLDITDNVRGLLSNPDADLAHLLKIDVAAVPAARKFLNEYLDEFTYDVEEIVHILNLIFQKRSEFFARTTEEQRKLLQTYIDFEIEQRAQAAQQLQDAKAAATATRRFAPPGLNRQKAAENNAYAVEFVVAQLRQTVIDLPKLGEDYNLGTALWEAYKDYRDNGKPYKAQDPTEVPEVNALFFQFDSLERAILQKLASYDDTNIEAITNEVASLKAEVVATFPTNRELSNALLVILNRFEVMLSVLDVPDISSFGEFELIERIADPLKQQVKARLENIQGIALKVSLVEKNGYGPDDTTGLYKEVSDFYQNVDTLEVQLELFFELHSANLPKKLVENIKSFFNRIKLRAATVLEKQKEEDIDIYLPDIINWINASETNLMLWQQTRLLWGLYKHDRGGITILPESDRLQIDKLLQGFNDLLDVVRLDKDVARTKRIEAIKIQIARLKEMKRAFESYAETKKVESTEFTGDAIDSVLTPYETADSNEKQYLGYTLAQMINTYHEGSASVNAWLNVFSYKLKQLGNSPEAKQLSGFLELFIGPLVEGFFSKKDTIDAQQLTAVRGENFIKLISDKINVYDTFRKSEDYQTIITPVGDLASLIMLKTYFGTETFVNEEGKTDTRLVVGGSHTRARVEVAKLLGIEVNPNTGVALDNENDKLLSEALSMLVKYEKNKKGSKSVDFGSPLVTSKTEDNVTQMAVSDWSANSSSWTNGDQLIKFCSEIVFRYSPTARNRLSAVNIVEEKKGIDRNVLTETYIMAALYDASFLSRRASCGIIILGRDGSALKTTYDNAVKGPGVLAAAPYKMFQNNVRGSLSTFTAFVSRFHEDFYQQIVTRGHSGTSTEEGQKIRLKRYQSRLQAAIRRLALEFGESEAAIAFPLEWKDKDLGYDEIINPIHRTKIGNFIEKYKYKPSLIPGSKPWQLPLQTSVYDFITGEDKLDDGNLEVKRKTNAREWRQTEEALEKLVALATESWAKDISGELSSAYKEGKLADKISDMIGKFGTEISISFAYIVNLDDAKKTELMMFLVGLLSSYLMYIFYSIPRSETKVNDIDYEKMFEIAVNEIASYFSPGKGTFRSVIFKSPNNDNKEWSIYQEFNEILKEALGGDAPLLKKKRPQFQLGGLLKYNQNRYESYWIAHKMLVESEKTYADWFVKQGNVIDKVHSIFAGRQQAVIDRTKRPEWVFPNVEDKDVKK